MPAISLAAGCAASSAGGSTTANDSGVVGDSPSDGQSESGGDAGWLEEICFLNDCDSDEECSGCPAERKLCHLSSHRCVRCIPEEPATVCGQGEVCSPYGTCIPENMTCPTDANGKPTITCTTDNDCYACDTYHQVCNTSTGECVACSDTSMVACAPTDTCTQQGECVASCPSPCTSDADCARCGTVANPGHVCNEVTHACAECSATRPCGDGRVCGPQGTCIAICGALDKPKGACSSDSDCSGCEGDLIACHKPVNGGDGKCGAPANGCSDIPGNFAVLPEPWSQVTNLCSSDSDCKGVSLDLNAGKLLHDLTGLDQIRDAVVPYGMNVCAAASVTVFGEDYACGVCLPCRKDADCDPIKFDPLVEQAFGPVGSLVSNVLLKMAFGDAPHQLNMYCQSVLGDYGVCAPCIDFLHACAVSPSGTEGNQCNSDWECASGQRCKAGKCTAYSAASCFVGDPCPSGEVCAWNGSEYCCRSPFPGTKACFSDATCAPQVCAWNGSGNFCVDPIACDQ